jgi:hypothetical protein
MVDKYVYSNLSSLLSSECPMHYAKYQITLFAEFREFEFIVIGENYEIIKDRIYIDNAEMY